MRYATVWIMVVALMPMLASAADAPPGQVAIDAGKVLRGKFTELHQMADNQPPIQSAGHFTVAPAEGLIWDAAQPFPTATIVTQSGAAQDIGGVALKLPAKNIRHLYDMIGGALAGDWNKLAQDFIITPSGDAHHWQMRLTPRQQDGKRALPYAAITVSGGKFVENIALAKADGGYDSLSFSDESLSAAALTDREQVLFREVK